MYKDWKNNKIKYSRVAIYLRLSDEDKNKTNKQDDSESIKNQRNLLLEEIKKRPEFILIDEYCDEDLSGAGTFRPEFERLIKDCENNKIDVVLCKSQSRFSRDMEVIEKYIHNKFLEWNIRFIGLTDNADTDVEGNKKSRQINGLVNEWFLEDTSNNIRSAFKAKMKQGEFISPFAAFGYEISKKDNNKLVIDPIAAETVKEIFNLYLKGLGFTAIAKDFNKRNIPSPSLYKYQKGIKLNIISNKPREEIKWSANAIKTILKNELYIGNLIQGKRTTISYKNHKIKNKNRKEWIKKENTHEAIIDKITFEKVQIAINERTKPIKTTGKVHNFSGKVFCLECKNHMRKKNSQRHEYLVCSNNKDSYTSCTNKKGIRYDILEKIVLDEINKKIQNYLDEKIILEFANKKIKQNIYEKIKKIEINLFNVKNKLQETEKYLNLLYKDRVNKIVTLEQFKVLSKQYNKEKTLYQKQLRNINSQIKFYKNKKGLENNNNFNTYKILKNLNKVIIDEFIKKIYIGELKEHTKTRNIEIKWNFKI